MVAVCSQMHITSAHEQLLFIGFCRLFVVLTVFSLVSYFIVWLLSGEK